MIYMDCLQNYKELKSNWMLNLCSTYAQLFSIGNNADF